MITPSSSGYKEYMKEAKALFEEYEKKWRRFVVLPDSVA